MTHELKIGHWINVHPLQADDEGAYMCSCCKVGNWGLKGTENYCPNCGAMMTESENISPHNATNGEMIQTMFPNAKIRWMSQSHIGITMKNNQDYITEFTLDWWNAPYNTESEE